MAAALGLFVRVRANGRVCGPHASGCLRSARRYYTLADTMRQHSMVNMQSVNVCSLNAPCFRTSWPLPVAGCCLNAARAWRLHHDACLHVPILLNPTIIQY